MLHHILLLTILTCPDTIMVDETKKGWTERDMKTFDVAKKECSKRKDGRSPCLKKFIKRREWVYHAVCGRPE